MALKPQQHKQPPARASKVLAPPKHEDSRNPWYFLELIDAPQWVDLSLEESLVAKEGSDLWFETSHRHHAISLAGLNSSALWLRVDKVSPTKQVKEIAGSNNRNRGGQKVPSRLKGIQNSRQVNKPDCSLQSYVKGVQVHWSSSKHINRASSAHCLPTMLNRSFDNGCTLSGSSCISYYEPNGNSKKHSSCSDRSSVSSSLQACSVDSDKFSLKISRASHDVPSRDSYSLPGGSIRNRSSSSASYCAPGFGSRCSTDSGVATSSTCERDGQSSGDGESSGQSVVTVASSISQEEIGKGFASMQEIKKARVKFEGNTVRYAGGSSTMNKNLLCCKHDKLGSVKHGVNAKEKMSGLSVSSSRKQGHSGKENVPPKVKSGNVQAAKPLGIVASLTRASSGTATGKANASSKFPPKTAISQHLKNSVQQRKICVSNELHARGLAHNKSEQDLAALVAQHNQKVRILGLQQGGKGLR